MNKNFRIKENKGRYILEYGVPIWWTLGILKRWRFINHYRGLPNEPFFSDSPRKALEGAFKQLKDDLI